MWNIDKQYQKVDNLQIVLIKTSHEQVYSDDYSLQVH